jgi:hypothetical protein
MSFITVADVFYMSYNFITTLFCVYSVSFF